MIQKILDIGLVRSRVSVVIPTFNRISLLPNAIQSVLNQTFTNYEVIIIDDGSTDDTCAAVERFKDGRIRYYYQQNARLAAARNAGIRQSQGEYIAFLDDDDMWLPEKLAVQTQILDGNPEIGLVTTGYQTINHEGKVLSEVQPWIYRPNLDLQTWLYACPTIPSAVMLRRQWLEWVGTFDEEISREACGAEDWDLWLRLAYSGCKMTWAQDSLCVYRIHPDSMMHHAKRQHQSTLLVLDKFFGLTDLPNEIRVEKNRVYSHALLRGASREYAAGLGEDAATDVDHAIQINPILLENHSEVLFGALVGWIGDPLVEDPSQYINMVFTHLPPSAAKLSRRKSEALGLAAKQTFFYAYQHADWKTVGKSFWSMLKTRPVLILDRGVFSVMYKMVRRRR